MNPIWMRTALTLGLFAFAALIIWPVAGLPWALGVVALGLAIVLGRHLVNLRALVAWLRDPLAAPVPLGSGVWEHVFSRLHRFMRATTQHQHRLTAQLARFRSAAQAMPDGVIVLDAEDHISWANAVAERDFSVDARRDRGQPILNLVRNPDFVAYLKGGAYEEPLTLRLAHGDELVLSVRVVPYGQEEKLLLSRDITQWERLETMRRDFVANVSHELKTPLTVVSGFLETITDGNVQLAEPRGQQVLGLMRSQTDRMLRLIDDLLTLSALESSAEPARERAIDIHQLLRVLAEEARAISGGRHTVQLKLGPPATLWGDEHEVRGALANLVSNAIRYTPKDGRITIEWAERDGEGWVTVEDTGIGIEARHIPRLTERFYRVDSSRSRDTGGTGLGLAIVKHVLTRHQARLEVASEMGRGSRFSAVFPERRAKWLAAQNGDEPTIEKFARS
ncbi:MAG TPA: phosphate regulon sensor histidine kinase PhoR [Burkholderiales bacterium]|nr:phosphate regulon sensor histidine kinase PhoR [Burkholderiales bacterium]